MLASPTMPVSSGGDEQTVGVVDLHAVHHGEVLIRTAAAHRDPAAHFVGGADTRQRLQRAKDVLEAARQVADIQRPERQRRRA